jgi:hypothetical protein
MVRVDRLSRKGDIQPDQTRCRGVAADDLDEVLKDLPATGYLALGQVGSVKIVPALQHVGQKLVLGPEVVEEARLGQADLLRDPLQRGATETGLCEELHGCGQGLGSGLTAG